MVRIVEDYDRIDLDRTIIQLVCDHARSQLPLCNLVIPTRHLSYIPFDLPLCCLEKFGLVWFRPVQYMSMIPFHLL